MGGFLFQTFQCYFSRRAHSLHAAVGCALRLGLLARATETTEVCVCVCVAVIEEFTIPQHLEDPFDAPASLSLTCYCIHFG